MDIKVYSPNSIDLNDLQSAYEFSGSTISDVISFELQLSLDNIQNVGDVLKTYIEREIEVPSVYVNRWNITNAYDNEITFDTNVQINFSSAKCKTFDSLNFTVEIPFDEFGDLEQISTSSIFSGSDFYLNHTSCRITGYMSNDVVVEVSGVLDGTGMREIEEALNDEDEY